MPDGDPRDQNGREAGDAPPWAITGLRRVTVPACGAAVIAAVVGVGLFPFTRRRRTDEAAAATALATALADLARGHGKPLGIVIDSGPAYTAYRASFTAAGLPVFDRMESALLGLRVLG